MAEKPEPWLELADLLCGPMVGHSLLAEMRARFPHIKRDDCFRAVALAWTYQQAGWLADAIELDAAKRAGTK